ncbi:MAG: cation-translocating P-type ATPase [Acidobacteriaceae bacterium]
MERGLTTAEAKKLRLQYGPNKIAERHSFSVLTALVSEMFSLLNILLIAAAIISLLIKDRIDGFFILGTVVLNTFISFWQEYKAEQTLSQLKLLAPAFARVIRDGKESMLSAELIVPGDLVVLNMGDKIPADGTMTSGVNCEVDESMLTGESMPVFKKPNEPEHNQIYAGTLVASGRAIFKVSRIGESTQFGKIAKTLTEIKEPPTPLQAQIRKLALQLAVIALICSALIYVIGLLLNFNRLEMFFTAVSSAVALVPEGLPSILIITMAVGVKRMAQKRAVVRKLIAIEGLASVNVICMDKTGTLTQGRMQVQSIFVNGKPHTVEEFKGQTQTGAGKLLMDTMVMVNTASLVYRFDRHTAEVLGDTTEGALLMLAHRYGLDYELYRTQGEVIDEFSFDQNRKSMSSILRIESSITSLVKGAPEYMISKSNRIRKFDKVDYLDEAGKTKLIEAYQHYARQGYRLLAFAYKDGLHQKSRYDRDEAETDLIFLGFVALLDPLRPEVKPAIKTAALAGIRSVMITGDNELTAMTIAKQLDLVGPDDEVYLGKDLGKISDEDLQKIIQKVKVFARTDPEDKLRIVRAFQKAGFSVAVTGDGVNDALALKQAEIGVAMGNKGTDVAKEAADIVITDDNYATIILAIEEGRTIYDNVLKSFRYLLSTNVGEILTILFALGLGMPSPFTPVQILWINLVTDSLPALALAVDPKDPHNMKKRPRPKEAKLIDSKVLTFLLSAGLGVALLSLGVYRFIYNISGGDVVLARTWVFTFMIILQMIVAFLVRGFKNKFNYNLLWAVILTMGVQFSILSIPAFYKVFEIKGLW